MGLRQTNFFPPPNYEEENIQIIICKTCSSHLCLSNLIISDAFHGRSGDALLVDQLINIKSDMNYQKSKMTTGYYLTDSIRCHQCSIPLGWYYKKSYSHSESYKEGKFVIEKAFIRMIPNNSCTGPLLRNKKLRRRSSGSRSEKSFISDSNDIAFRYDHSTSSPISETNDQPDVKPPSLQY